MSLLIITLAMLYFPLLPNIELGPFKASATVFPIFLMAGGALLKLRQRNPAPKIVGWQKILLLFLGLSFTLSSIFTASLNVTLSLLPNMLLYLLILFSIPILVDSNQNLVTLAKTIMLLAFILSIWKVELGPFREYFGLSGLGGINGIVFSFHPAVAIGFIVLLVRPGWFSRGWQWFSALTLLSLILHGVEFQTRAAWIAWIIIMVILISRLPVRHLSRLIFVMVPVIFLLLRPYMSMFVRTLEETQQTLAAVSSDYSGSISKDDLIREVGLKAGIAMFRERPLIGWGPGLFPVLLGQYNPLSVSGRYELGAFNAWLLSLTETGIIGVIATLALVLTPFWISWRQLRKEQTDDKWLAFAFVLGAVSLAIHLLFISLMFSFFWIHLGLALAGARLVAVDNNEKTSRTISSQRILKFNRHYKMPLRYQCR